MRNTVVGKYPETREDKKFKIKISDIILQDLIKATYLRDIYIEDAFIKFAKMGRENIVSQNALYDTFLSLGIKIDTRSAKDTYEKFLNNSHGLTAKMVDLAVEDNAKKGIEEIQKSILELINRSIKAHPEITIREVFLKYDRADDGIVSFAEFEDSVKNYMPKIKSMDALFLAKRYCIRDNYIDYKIMLEEIDMLDKGQNPLMTWAQELAETIVKGVVAHSTTFAELFTIYSPGKSYISEDNFVKAMQHIGVDKKFETMKLRKFYYFIDDDKSQKVEFREMESIVKTHCTKSSQRLLNEILEKIKEQMEEYRVKVRDVYDCLDRYSSREVVKKIDFRRALLGDLKLNLDDIDIDFACEMYKDKIHKKSVRYSTFMDDLKQKFELTETYVVPGVVRKEPSHTKDDLLLKPTIRRDFDTPRKEDDYEIKAILNDLKVSAHDKRIDLEAEFRRVSPRKKGIVPRIDFENVIYD